MANQRDDSGHPVILTGSIGNNYQARGGACIRANESSYLCRSSWSEDALSSGTLASRVPGSAPALTPLRLASEGSPAPVLRFLTLFPRFGTWHSECHRKDCVFQIHGS